MNLTFTHRHDNPRLLLIMAGWGMDPNPFATLRAPGYDIAIGWDYTHETLDTTPLAPYREIVLMAWSMGVFESERILPRLNLPLTLTIAVNGTLTPVNDTTGIPVDIFRGTLATLSDDNLTRFNRRMCGSRDTYSCFTATAPRRDITSLRDELTNIGHRALSATTPAHHLHWDLAVISDSDMIFPAHSQVMAWTHAATLHLDGPHLPDFALIIDRLLVDKQRVADRFDHTRTGYDSHAATQHRVADLLTDRLLTVTPRRHFSDAIEIGAGSLRLTHSYTPHLTFDRLQLWDIAPLPAHSLPPHVTVITDDAEARLLRTPDHSADLVITASTLQWFNSPVTALHNIQRILRPGGIAAIATYTDGTYRSVGRATHSTINYVSPDRLLSAVSPGNTILFSNLTEDTETFPSTLSLLNHMKQTGVNGTRNVPPTLLRRLIRDDSLRQLEYNTLYLIIQAN